MFYLKKNYLRAKQILQRLVFKFYKKQHFLAVLVRPFQKDNLLDCQGLNTVKHPSGQLAMLCEQR